MGGFLHWLTNKVWQQKGVLRGHNTIFYIQKDATFFNTTPTSKFYNRLAAVSLRSCVICPKACSNPTIPHKFLFLQADRGYATETVKSC
jgi:hypothetical protein